MSETSLKTLLIAATGDTGDDATTQGMKLGFRWGYSSALVALGDLVEETPDKNTRKALAFVKDTLEEMAPGILEAFSAEIAVEVADAPVSGSA